ncbi:hypothetical protein NDI45_25100 [Leptolyngbya sp. GB1-A1]|uniref:hypothetical protein n=1 Tax=Leptolyngbya sp. GB1-A1 TaxID=2933908 RepID=UPI0032999EDD
MNFAVLVSFLAPFLPSLFNLGTKAAESVAEKFGEDAWEKAKSLWSKLRPKVEAKPLAQGAAQELAQNPNDEDAREALTKQLQKILEADPALAAEIARLLEDSSETVHKVVNVTQSVKGDRNITFGQSDGTVNINQS